ncbi:MAG: tRNA (N(6)-L-threonylcarbamoyladenosine(37)-C(2))-methylthiotransferase [Thaumarchaeota archaeon]|nr:tRNA (N(6)-L-threonylcarbamoyladenosine(37)-C(2))-methylthiotransferase [Nitrososphaerota archaeon]
MAKIWVEAYGCSASFADSEMISGLILNGGHTLAQNSSDSDLNLVVTCSVKDATANKMINRIKSLKHKPLVVAGCLPKAERTTVEKFSPNASLLGPNSIGQTLQVINSTLKGKRRVELADSDLSKVGLPKVRLNPVVGIVEVASGCMSECTFCQTKLSKGDLRSYRIGDIVRQVRSEIDEGCKEIWLTSTDNGCYGLDIGTDLPTLITEVVQIEHDFLIRVGMMNPMYMPRIRDNLLKAFENDKVLKFLHIPVQSGSNAVLKEMKRGHTADVFKITSEKFRKKFENFAISTDIIVGFPSESEDDFQQTVRLIEETKPDIINLSRYSARPGTKAAEMKQIRVSEVKRRTKIIFELAKKVAYERNKKWIGWIGEVFFDESSNGIVKGRNFAYKPVVVKENVRLGEKIKVEITDATKHVLYGKTLS